VIRTLGAGITGDATDTNPITGVRIAIRQLDANSYWWSPIDDDFTPPPSVSPVFNAVSAPYGSWTYPVSGLGDDDLISGTSYYITSEATDAAGNVETDFATGSSIFIFDSSSPVTVVTRPQQGGVVVGTAAYYSSFSSMTGTADDYTFLPASRQLNAGLASTAVRVSIKDAVTGSYWHLGNQSFTETDEPASFNNATFVGASSGTWAYSPTGLASALTSLQGHTFIIKSSGTDTVGNVQATTSSQELVFDSSSPVIGIILPAAEISTNTLVLISGTARDLPATLKRVGMAHVDLQIIDLGADTVDGGGDDLYWDDGSSTFSGTPSTTSITVVGQVQVNWSYSIADTAWTSGHRYRIRSTAYDALQNKSSQASVRFVFDSSAPVSVVTRPAEGIGYNGTTNALLTISATADDLPATPLLKAGLDLNKVKINVIKDVDDDNTISIADTNWNGDYSPGTFGPSPVDIALHSDGGVLFSTAAPTWESGRRYFVVIWSEDVHGHAVHGTDRFPFGVRLGDGGGG
jgi:hypothetical protein